MKWMIPLLMAFSASLWARPLVLVSYYDKFGEASFNNSERVAKALAVKMGRGPVEVSLCALSTVFDKSYEELESCLKSLRERPVMVIGLGEATCDLKVEIATQNYDKTMGPDNEGHERKGVIIKGAPAFLPMRYPLPQMYCALAPGERGTIDVSSNAGTFVCNNTAYQLNHYYPDLFAGFIHVPNNGCRSLDKKNEAAVNILESMIIRGAGFLGTQFAAALSTPHSSNELRLPITKEAIKRLRNAYENDPCMKEFFKRTRGVDDKGFWSFLR